MYRTIIPVLLIGIQTVHAECAPTLWETSKAIHEACLRGLLSEFQCDTWIPEVTKMQSDQKIMQDTSNAVLQYQDDWAKRIKKLEME